MLYLPPWREWQNFVVQQILKDDIDFQNYLSTFVGTNYSDYSVKKSTGKEFTQHVFDVHGKDTFVKLIANPPNTRELKRSTTISK